MAPAEKYQQAVAEIQEAIREAERLVCIVSSGASALRDWRRMTMSNVEGGFPLLPHNPGINGSEWPTGQQVAAALQRYHRAKESLHNAYMAIPDGERAIVKTPATFF